MKKNIKHSTQDFLNSFELNEEQLASFAQLEKDCLQEPTKRANKSWLSIAASFLLGAVLLAGVYKLENGQQSGIMAIAAEVSYNHLNLKPLEVARHQLNQVTGYFKKLDFNPMVSARVTGLSSHLIGGRYCSIQGNIAAQLRMKNETGQLSTLFESRFNPQDFNDLPVLENGQAPVQVFVDGQQVDLWVEKGLVMALVQAAPE